LEGGIDRQEVLQPLFTGLAPGSDFSTGQYQSYKNATWVKIPRWISGTWTALSALRIFKYDEQSGQTDNSSQIIQKSTTESFGLQRDNAGDVWTLTADPSPVVGQEQTLEGADGTAAKNKTVKTYTLSKNDFSSPSNDQLKINGTTSEARIDAISNKVLSIESHKVERQFVLMANNLMACNVDDKTFDRDGFPVYHQKYALIYRKSSEFEPKDEREYIRVRSSFEKYLEGIGRLDLKKGM
jgi:hypothetical protein